MRYLVLTLLLAIASSLSAQKTSVDTEITQTKIKAHLTYLASDALRGRDTGSEGAEAAAAYIASRLMAYGAQPLEGMEDYMQPVPLVRVVPPSRASMTIGDESLSFPDDFLVLNGKNGKSLDPLIFVPNAEKDASWTGVDAKLKVVVTNAGSEESNDVGQWLSLIQEKRKKAMAAGAIGMIEIYQNANVPWSLLKRMGTQERLTVEESQGDQSQKRQDDFLHIWLSTENENVMTRLKEGGASVEIQVEGSAKNPVSTANVVGMVPGTDAELRDDYIVYGAHYDHVGVGRADATGDTIYNGARDNAVGAAAVLSMAEYIGANPTRRSALFVLFTGEEKGLLGSNYFVNNSPVDLEQIKYCYNIDNGGYNDTTIISVIGLTRTTAEDIIQKSCQEYSVTAIEDAAGEQGLFDRSDNVNFAKKGIPAPTFSLGFTAFDDEIFKYYHQPGDEVQTLNMNYIEKYVKSYILSGTRIADSEMAPVWREGDKYYEVGLELYKDK